DNADAILKGSGDESIYNDRHSSSDSIGLHAGGSTGSGSSVRFASSSAHQSGSVGISQNETSKSDERRREAVASVRLVAADGDVIWSTTQESQGAKFRGSMADVADKIAKKLAEETNRARLAARKPEAPETNGQ
ncbi:MAG TPA: hypothetical protein VNH18_00490, partial [Bryobacteraceae bacterium]|nr:hypothetical protein [Bryobacteraceae bacterium]